MANENLAIFLALASTLLFSSASIVFAEYSRRVSVIWMNCFKAFVAFVVLIPTVPLLADWSMPEPKALAGFMTSGLVGLNIADLFLLSAFVRLGAARTLILFGFTPLMVGIGAFYLFDQPFAPSKLVAVLFLIGCLFTLSLESYKKEKRWELSGLAFALIGVALDACGILITRASYAASPDVAPVEGHFWRCVGALIGFALMSFYQPINLKAGFMQWPARTRTLLVVASVGGAFLSLLLYMTAIKIGHLASIAGIAITGPMFATILESIAKRKPPSAYLIVAFIFFACGFYVLLSTS